MHLCDVTSRVSEWCQGVKSVLISLHSIRGRLISSRTRGVLNDSVLWCNVLLIGMRNLLNILVIDFKYETMDLFFYMRFQRFYPLYTTRYIFFG